MAFTPTDPTKAEVRITGTAPNQSLEFYIPQGAKGDPGIQGNQGVQGVKGDPGDMSPVVGGNPSGTFAILDTHLPSTRNWNLTSNITITLPTPSAEKSGTITLVMAQDTTGGRTITWPSSLKWPDAIAQQPAAAANSVSVIHLFWTGTQWLGLLGGKSFA